MVRYDRLVLLPLVLLFAGLFYWIYYMGHEEKSYYLIPVVMALVAVYMFTPQISWWGYSRYPVRVDPVIRKMLHDNVPFYRALGSAEQERFDKRLWLSIRHKEWTGMKLINIPEDIKAMVMIPAIILTFHQTRYLFDNYERIYLYKHPFPSPDYPVWHASETHHADGVLLFSIEQLFQAFVHVNRFYNTALHEWAGVYLREYAPEEAASMKWLDASQLDQIAPYSLSDIEKWLGLPIRDIRQVNMHHFIRFPDVMQRHFPNVYTQIGQVFD